MCKNSAFTGGSFLIWTRGMWWEWERLFEHRAECRRELGRPWVRRKSPGGPFQIPSNERLCEAKVGHILEVVRKIKKTPTPAPTPAPTPTPKQQKTGKVKTPPPHTHTHIKNPKIFKIERILTKDYGI